MNTSLVSSPLIKTHFKGSIDSFYPKSSKFKNCEALSISRVTETIGRALSFFEGSEFHEMVFPLPSSWMVFYVTRVGFELTNLCYESARLSATPRHQSLQFKHPKFK